MWSRRLAAPKPVGPAPMTRTSTLLQILVSNTDPKLRRAPKGRGNLHVRHGERRALKSLDETAGQSTEVAVR